MPPKPRSEPDLRPGDVIVVWDRETNPEKHKRHVCVCPERQLFLRINSRAIFQPAFQVLVAECDFLDHDSYIELTNLCRLHEPDIIDGRKLGRLTADIASRLLQTVELRARTLTPEQKRLIHDQLTGPEGPIG